MKRFVIFLSFFALFPSLLLSDLYIKLGATTNEENLKRYNSYLKRNSLNMLVQRKDQLFVVYSGPFTSKESITAALKKIRRALPNATAVRLYDQDGLAQIEKKETTLPQNAQNVSAEEEVALEYEKSGEYFATLYLGAGATSANKKVVDSDAKIKLPKNNGFAYALEGGYLFESGLTLALGVHRVDTSHILFENIYIATTYPFYEIGGLELFGGALVGTSDLKWDFEPLVGAVNSENDSSSLLFAPQVGMAYFNMAWGFDLLLDYSYMILGHTTNLMTTKGTSKISYANLHSVRFGFRYRF